MSKRTGEVVICEVCEKVKFYLPNLKAKPVCIICRQNLRRVKFVPTDGHKRGSCIICRRDFWTMLKNQVVCSAECRAERTRRLRKKYKNETCSRHDERSKNGFYVYAWYKMGKRLPFYIGKGKSDRAFVQTRGSGPDEIRVSDRIEVKILRDGLTEEGALLAESVLIDFLRSHGVKLINKVDKRRNEKPPLVMSDTELLLFKLREGYLD